MEKNNLDVSYSFLRLTKNVKILELDKRAIIALLCVV